MGNKNNGYSNINKVANSAFVNNQDAYQYALGKKLGGIEDPDGTKYRAYAGALYDYETSTSKAFCASGIIYLIFGIIALVLTLFSGLKNMQVAVTLQYWETYPNEKLNITQQLGTAESFSVPLGIPVSISMLLSGVVKLYRAFVNRTHTEGGWCGVFKITRYVLVFLDDFVLFAATFFDLALISGITDAFALLCILALVASASLFSMILEVEHRLLKKKETFWLCAFAFDETKLCELYILPLMGTFVFTFAPLVGIAWYYANSLEKKEYITALISLTFFCALIWRFLDITRHSFATYPSTCFVYFDLFVETVSAITLGYMTFAFFLYV
jgi:uncharacterized membrane protein HdeD (DUF308 family)